MEHKLKQGKVAADNGAKSYIDLGRDLFISPERPSTYSAWVNIECASMEEVRRALVHTSMEERSTRY